MPAGLYHLLQVVSTFNCSSNLNAVQIFEAEIFNLFESKHKFPTNVGVRDRNLDSIVESEIRALSIYYYDTILLQCSYSS